MNEISSRIVDVIAAAVRGRGKRGPHLLPAVLQTRRVMGAPKSIADLADVLRSYEYEEYGSCSLINSAFTHDALELTLEVNPGKPRGGPVGRWVLRAEHVLDHRLALGWADPRLLLDEPRHRLLSPFVEDATELTFTGTPSSVAAVVGDLVAAHEDWGGEWFPLDAFLRQGAKALLGGGYGQLAQGPDSLMRGFAEVLRDHGVKSAIVPVNCTITGSGNTIEKVRATPQALIFVASARRSPYVVAKKLSATWLTAGERTIAD